LLGFLKAIRRWQGFTKGPSVRIWRELFYTQEVDTSLIGEGREKWVRMMAKLCFWVRC
jgi:hypothetical protein